MWSGQTHGLSSFVFLVYLNSRPHRSTTYVDVVYCYRPSSVVCRSVSRSVCHSIPAKTAELIEMLFGLRIPVGPRIHVLDGVQIPDGKDNFEGKGEGRPINIGL